MPSPIAHIAIGYAISRALRSRKQNPSSEHSDQRWRMLSVIGLSMLPDIDTIPGLLLGNFARYHNQMTHSISFGAIMAVLVGGVVYLSRGSGFKRWFVITLVSYQLHILMDFFTRGRGVMLVWPLSSERFSSRLKLFNGARWSEGVISPEHLVTLGTELGFVGLIAIIGYALRRNRRYQRQKK